MNDLPMNEFTLREITDKNEWEAFIASRPEANFLQSWNWGQFHRQLGKTVAAFGLFQAGQQVAGAIVVKEKAKRGTYLTIAGGPLLDPVSPQLTQYLTALFQELARYARAENCRFIRVRPQLLDTPGNQELFKTLGFQVAPMHLTADITLQLDLTKPAELLLSEMRKNTRYEVRQAEKLGVTVTETQDPAALQRFYQDQLYLAKKHGFVPFSERFLTEQFRAFVVDNQVVLFNAEYQGQVLATAFIIFYNGEAVYHYGTSTPANAKLPGSYACQWAAILAAQQRGCTRYNMWGIAPEGNEKHRFAGVSLFKRGFGGQEVAYLPALDLPLHWSYSVTRTFELLRKKMRRLE